MKCIICGQSAEIHHVLRQKPYPELKDKKFNQMALCRPHHSEWHGGPTMVEMADKYFQIKIWFINNLWSYCETKDKYVPPSYT